MQALNQTQIQAYFARANRLDLWNGINNDADLLKLAETPLILKIMVQAYQQSPTRKLHNFSSPEDRRQAYLDDLFDAYIKHKLEEPKESKWYERGKEPTPEETKRWLAWLAKKLKDKKQTEFLIEKMQPTWLEKSYQRWLYRVAVGLISGLIFGLIFGLIARLIAGLIFGLILGLIAGLIPQVTKKIELTESFNLSWHKIRENWRKIINWLVFWLILGLTVGLILRVILGLIFGLIAGLIFGLIFGLIYEIIAGLQTDIKNRIIPNQGIWESVKNGLIITLLTTPEGVFIYYVRYYLLNFERTLETVSAIIFGLGFGLTFGFAHGGISVIQHCVLRFILWQSGCSPRSYKHFFGYASERGFILQVGGRYRFIHDLLREHFAKMG